MKKKHWIFLLLPAMIFCAAAACEQALDPVTEEKAEAICEQVVGYLADGDYQAVADLARPDLADQFTAEALEKALAPMLAEAGEFVRFRDTGATRMISKEDGEEYILTATLAKFQHEKFTVSVYLDPTDFSLVGLYMK